MAAAIALSVIAICLLVGYVVDRYLSHKEIMAGKREVVYHCDCELEEE